MQQLDLSNISKAVILTIGYELLQGRVINTNASFIARKLYLLGINVKAMLVVGDDLRDIVEALRLSVSSFDADMIITTGGLGPTPDDRTLEAIATFAGLELEVNPEALKDIEAKYRSKGVPLTEERLKMAMLPQGSIPLPNPVGIAPGVYLALTRPKVIIIALPGVPQEMEAIFEKYIEPQLRKSRRLILAEGHIRLRTMESEIAGFIKQVSKSYPSTYIKSHPEGKELGKPVVKIYISAYSQDASSAEKLCTEVLRKFIDYAHERSIDIAEVQECRSAT
ncbi:MAG: competence damage-inducible protein A [Thermoprotei archaeon]|nr:MAG: competence damage-inducible protein A [Thermoprotei archaeon]